MKTQTDNVVVDLEEARYAREGERQRHLREQFSPPEIQNEGTSLSYPGTRVTGAKVQRVGVAFQYLQPELDGLVDHNAWTSSQVEVVRTEKRLVFRATLFGWHPFHEMERVAVIGYGDRHYLAMKAAQRTWTEYLGELFVNDLAGANADRGAEIIQFPRRDELGTIAA